MGAVKRPYEISIWSEILGENGQKIEHKDLIIGSHDMEYLGRATSVKFGTKLNGTHTLTFSLPDKFYDSKIGDYVLNEFVDQLYNERKVKFKYKGKWYELYIKSISDAKNYKSYMKTYSCSDAFIDELSRNGYGLTFDEDLYNNVEEVGTFTEEIVDDSIWNYSPENNWGDFTEFLEERLYKIPVSQFKDGIIEAYKLNFEVDNSDSQIINAFTNEKRPIELGDDLARKEELFWDQIDQEHNHHNSLINNLVKVENDGFIYVPYSQLDFCYKTTQDGLTATEEPAVYSLNGQNKSYALAPKTIDPSALIQFIAVPAGEQIEIDEAGTIVNKNFNYVMTVEQWNRSLAHNKNFYLFEPFKQIYSQDGVLYRKKKKEYDTNKIISSEQEFNNACITGNFSAYYEGYIEKLGDLEVIKGKKISISDRTEINITEEIDQYVKVYNQQLNDVIANETYYKDMLEDINDGKWKGELKNYKICSKSSTRQVVPQLARNLVQNGVNMRSTDGWEVVKLSDSADIPSTKIQLKKDTTDNGNKGILQFTKSGYNDEDVIKIVDVNAGEGDHSLIVDPEHWGTHDYNTIINFGIVGQGVKLKKDKIYVLGIKGKFSDFDAIIIGEGSVIGSGDYKIYWEHENLNYTGNFYSFSSIFTERCSKDSDIREKVREGFIFIKTIRDYENPYLGIWLKDNSLVTDKDEEGKETEHTFIRELHECWFFEAFTKGIDQFPDIDEKNPAFKYSGREIIKNNNISITPQNYANSFSELYWNNTEVFTNIPDSYTKDKIKQLVLFEDDIMPGDTYEYQQYFIQQVCAGNEYKDTFKQKKFLSEDGTAPFNSKDYTEDDLEINTRYFNLNKCPYYTGNNKRDACDCCFGGTGEANKICLYQKYGYCPYLFQTEKHCRKIRTLKKDKSNRFNLTQELSKVFEIYPMYFVNNDSEGHIAKIKKQDENGKLIDVMDKRIFYITEKGQENKLGFRYEKNLSNISRTLKSDKIVTKLYVQDVDSDISRTGLCSIKTAEDNPSKDSFIIDLSYYVAKSLIDEDTLQRDLYGIDAGDMSYLKQLGYYNSEYDRLSNLIINLQSDSYTELEANVGVNIQGIIAQRQQLHKLKKQIDKYQSSSSQKTLQNTLIKLEEQIGILNNLYEETFDPANTNTEEKIKKKNMEFNIDNNIIIYSYWTLEFEENDIIITPENLEQSDFYKSHSYLGGMLGQFNKEYIQIQQWKKQRAAYLELINKLSSRFYKKYEPYLKEGTWTDSNYITDNAYYFGALEVAAEGAIPKVSYTITTTDISALPEYSDDYNFEIADTTYVEDIGMFGVNQKTGLPNRLKVLISGITESPDQPTSNSITVQNFTTQFEDLFKQVSASVQSLTYNENVYKRSSNFTSTQNIKEQSLQGTLDTNNLTLLNTKENNIEIDNQGQAGSDINNHSNKYKLNGEGLFFSNNGGQSWNIGVGPSGINADYIKVGNLDAGKIKIVDNDFLYFYWDKNGIMALREPQSTENSNIVKSYTMFNRYGLSLVEDEHIRLRAGYAFNGKSGEISSETTQSKELGFYLYDSHGDPIFITSPTDNNETSDKDQHLTARLSLRGEIFATDGVLTSDDAAKYYCLKRKIENKGKAMPMVSIENVDLQNLQEKTIEEIKTELLENPRIFNPQHCYDNNSQRLEFGWTKQLLIYSSNKELSPEHYTFYYDNQEQLLYLKYTKDGEEWFIDYSNNDDDKEDYWIITDYQAEQPIKNCKDSSGITDLEADNMDKKLYTNVFYPDNGYQEGNCIYNYNGEYYCSWDEPAGKKDVRESTIGLFLNNKINNNSEENADNKRILSCVKSEPGMRTKNILSILKNGNLYIGGDVVANNTSVLYLSDKININDAGIALIKNSNTGQYEIQMDFNNIKDTQNDQIGLTDYIAGSIGSAIDDAVSNLEIEDIKGRLNTIIDLLNVWINDTKNSQPLTPPDYDYINNI